MLTEVAERYISPTGANILLSLKCTQLSHIHIQSNLSDSRVF